MTQNRTKILFVVCFALFCVVGFSGQRRPTTTRQPQQPQRQPQRQAAAPKETRPEPEARPQADLPLVVLRPDHIHWPAVQSERRFAPQTITLLGDPRSENLYVTRTRIPRGQRVLPHYHTDSRTVVVLSGTYYYGLGDTFDETKLVAFPAGSFLTEPAGVPHFTWAKDDEVVIQTTAIGPSGTRVIPDQK